MNKRLRIAIVIVAVTLIAALAISFAYSKYFTKETKETTATIAKWQFDVKMNGQPVTAATINLGNTAGTDYNSKVADGKLAPGTKGEFSIELDATNSEVTLDYEITLANLKNSANTPVTFPDNLKFYEDAAHTTPIADITSTGVSGTIAHSDAASNKVKTLSIYWEWEYETGSNATDIATNDVKDTNAGEDAAANPTDITFDVIVKGTQQRK